MCVHVCVPEVDVRYLPLQLSLPAFTFWVRPLLEPRAFWLAVQADWWVQGPPISMFPGQVYRCLSSNQAFYMGSEYRYSSLHSEDFICWAIFPAPKPHRMRFLRNLHLILSHSIFTSKLNYDVKTRTVDIYGEDKWEGVLMNILGWEIHFICCKHVSYTDVCIFWNSENCILKMSIFCCKQRFVYLTIPNSYHTKQYLEKGK